MNTKNWRVRALFGLFVIGIILISGCVGQESKINETKESTITETKESTITETKESTITITSEEVIINLIINETTPVYTYYGEIRIYRLNESIWEGIQKTCSRLGCYGERCINGTLGFMCSDPASPYCIKIENKEVLSVWDREECIWVKKLCGTKEYDEGIGVKAHNGKYKAAFCYYLDNCSYDEKERKCIEKEFELK